jgi:hypothetical protein
VADLEGWHTEGNLAALDLPEPAAAEVVRLRATFGLRP